MKKYIYFSFLFILLLDRIIFILYKISKTFLFYNSNASICFCIKIMRVLGANVLEIKKYIIQA